jgi:hypothetical protein
VDPDDITFIGVERDRGMTDVHSRYRFRSGAMDIDAILPTASATVWLQSHPGEDEDAMDAWARQEGEAAIRRRLRSDPLGASDVVLRHDVDEGRQRPPYGSPGMPHR